MKLSRNFTMLLASAAFAAAFAVPAQAQEDSLQTKQQEKENQLSIGISFLSHGETRNGGVEDNENENRFGADATSNDKAHFLMSRTRLSVGYQKTGLEAKVAAQHSGIWGQKGQGTLNLYEAWAKMSMTNGLFAQVGRIALAYDDERIIGPNDWAMAGKSHDVLRLGYEGKNHKLHAILAYNQNAENVTGGTYYADGAQPYKTMHMGWYHYDLPAHHFGASLLFMNVGMQGGEKDGHGNNRPRTIYQRLFGGYLSYLPDKFQAEASYYRQNGKHESGIPIRAWMASIVANWQPHLQWNVQAGYDFLSGDKFFAVPADGQIGMVQHTKIRGFSPVYGSHHKFYGMMDFFYVSSFLYGFTPGLQNLYAGLDYKPVKDLKFSLRYHYLATATDLDAIDRTLGHDVDIEASYAIMKEARLSLGFSYMKGTESMERLKRADSEGRLKWGWFSLVVNPNVFKIKW